MLKNIFFGLFSLYALSSLGQVAPGKWHDHFAYSKAKGVVMLEGKVYVATEEGYYTYDKNSGEIEKFSRITGLSSFGVSTISVFPEIATVAIGFSDGSINLIKNGTVTAITDIKDKSIAGDKAIYSMILVNGKIYAGTGFGIVVVDPSVPEVKDTYYVGSGGSPIAVYALLTFNGNVFAATATGIKYASPSDPLIYSFERWNDFSPNASGRSIVGLVSQNNNLYALEQGIGGMPDVVYQYTDGPGWTSVTSTQSKINSINASSKGLCITGDKGVEIISNGVSQLVNSFGLYWFAPRFSYFDGNDLWSADDFNGLVKYRQGNTSNYKPNGPFSNEAFRGTWLGGTLVTTRGGYRDVGENSWNGFLINYYRNNQWNSEWGQGNDAFLPVINPTNPTEFAISGWGSGITLFKNDKCTALYGESNSTLKSIYPGQPYVHCSGVCYDSDGNLWVNNSGVTRPLSVLKPDGTWTDFSLNGVVNQTGFGPMFFQQTTGHLWMALPKVGMLVYDRGSDSFSENDDRCIKFSLVESSGAALSNDILSMVQDNEGKIWIGTQEGVEVIYNTESAFHQTITAQRIKVPIEIAGQAAYLLKNDAVSAIAVDGANRKWFGTMRSGAFLQSADGVDQLLAFNMANSPLPSNTILDITIDHDSGEIFFITDKGIVGYRGDAIGGGEDFGKVYAYPNPVRETYNGKVTIVGLIPKATVKITEINGYLVFEGESLGGEIQWDGKNLNGQRVNTGVYLIFCSDATGEKSAVSKLLFIH